MKWTVRIPQTLLGQVQIDLARPHHFAAERVGFVFGRTENQEHGPLLFLANDYASVPDDDYIDDPTVVARIGGSAIRSAMQAALSRNVGCLHVHVHEHSGRPSFSRVDLRDTPPIVTSLQAAAPGQAHGALLLSLDACNGYLLLPGTTSLSADGKLVVVGRPMGMFPAGAIRG